MCDWAVTFAAAAAAAAAVVVVRRKLYVSARRSHTRLVLLLTAAAAAAGHVIRIWSAGLHHIQCRQGPATVIPAAPFGSKHMLSLLLLLLLGPRHLWSMCAAAPACHVAFDWNVPLLAPW
jgi:hypothetical protein